MKQIKITEHESIVFTQLAIENIKQIQVYEFERYLQQFINRIQLQKVQTTGPLIHKLCGSTFTGQGDLLLDYILMVQSEHDTPGFETIASISLENCLRVEFCDHPRFFDLSHQKLSVYLYEHEYVSTGELYTLFYENSETCIHAVMYVPLEGASREIIQHS
ncbi:hypothetical protein A4S06_04520 [Erysipelotrichaceae bacterium MTC7]|nr:hypothetical protein A4S06_04520 [Erysipelotrichaceae bacterium MTC7]